MANTAWQDVRHKLLSESDRDFERVVFPYLRIAFPQLCHPSSLGGLDKKGVDIGYVLPGEVMPVVIQCKGFKVTVDELGKSQIDQVGNSVKRFRESGLRCQQYILLYNRGGENQIFESNVKIHLASLVTEGLAKTAALWSLNKLLKELERELDNAMVKALSAWSADRESQRPRLFSFDDVVMEDVPCKRSSWSLRQGVISGVTSGFEEITAEQMRSQLISRRKGAQWSLVVGSYGIGKSTLMRNMKLPTNVMRVLVPAAVLTHVNFGGGSENALAEFILRFAGCLTEVAENTRLPIQELERLCGPSLSRVFRNPSQPMVLIIDGLDENRVYASANGFRLLANELRRMEIPVILTTRKEHFLDSYLDLQDHATPIWLNKPVETEVFELSEWTAEVCGKMLGQISANSTPAQQSGLQYVRRLIERDTLPLIVSHPLWFAMSIDLVLSGEAASFDALFELYKAWSMQKFLRDLEAPGRELPSSLPSAEYARRVNTLMKMVAVKMCGATNGALLLYEEISDEVVDRMAKEVFPGERNINVLVTQNSLLMPTSIRTVAGLSLRFSHQSFQEYYTATAIKDGEIACEGLQIPIGVQGFL